MDNWIGVALLVLINAALLGAVWLGMGMQFAQSVGVVFLELVYAVPVLLIFVWRHIPLSNSGSGDSDGVSWDWDVVF